MTVFLKKLHKWVGLLIGIQVLLWLLSGFMLSLINPEKVSGREWARADSQTHPVEQAGAVLEPGELTQEQLNGALSISLDVNREQPVYVVTRVQGTTLIDAVTGSVITTSGDAARTLARQDFTGDGEILSVERGLAPDMETRRSQGEYWRVNFSDGAETSIYISVSTGEILERRNNYWRVFDFFWMLHIMDYPGHEDINNTLIIIVALIAIWLGISGFILLFSSFNRHNFYFLNILGKRQEAVITLLDPAVSNPQQVKLRRGGNLFLSLVSHDINVPSDCGGGGECGKCRVKFEAGDVPAANAIERGLVPKPLRTQGYRLACQHEVDRDITLHLRKGTLAEDCSSTS